MTDQQATAPHDGAQCGLNFWRRWPGYSLRLRRNPNRPLLLPGKPRIS